MRISCPHCRRAIEVVADEQAVSCPSCGSRLNFFDETLFQAAADVKIVAHFELIEHVGRGHFGDVWKARDVVLDRFVAVKIPRTRQLEPGTIHLFVREARAAAKLRHENIVAVHEIVQDHEAVYIVSDFIQGVTLAEELRYKRRSPREAAELCATIADALDYAHNNGVNAHRDVKPGNIMIDADGKPYIMDFGLAKLEAADFTMTVAGQILGTPAYMSPEQAQGIEADHRSDIYSLGVVLYELLTRNRPFTGETRLLLQQILGEEPRPPRKLDRTVPRNLETICLKAMSKDPHRRYATAAEFAADLRRFLKGEPILARPVGPAERSWRWAKRNPVVAAASGTAVVLAVMLGLMAWQRHEETQAGLRNVVLQTDPPGAEVVFVPINEVTREPIEEQIVRPSMLSPVEVSLKPGNYLVVAERKDHGFHEVYRIVPVDSDGASGGHNHNSWKTREDGAIELPTIKIPKTLDVIGDMTRFDEGPFLMGSPAVPGATVHPRDVSGYYLDQTEVTIGAYGALQTVPLELANRSADEPVTFVNIDQAMHFAELAGKRLMTEAEYEYAATEAGTQRFPWGDDVTKIISGSFAGRAVRTPEFDQTPTDPPVFGLFSNVAEWTDSTPVPYALRNTPERISQQMRAHIVVCRAIRGGPASEGENDDNSPVPAEILVGAKYRFGDTQGVKLPTLGFRCARSVRARYVE